MKVNMNDDTSKVKIDTLPVGTPFLACRKSAEEEGIYMKVDAHSGLTWIKYSNDCLAVNLSTGQLRAFITSILVTPVKAEVNVVK